MLSAHVERFFAILEAANPNPHTELLYQSTFELLIAVMLSAQTTDVAVNRVTRKLFAQANTPADLLTISETQLCEQLKTLGLYRSKARHVLATCQRLLQEHNGEVPYTRAELEKLPGVGHKTASVVLNVAFGLPTIAVDTHVFRVSRRTGLAQGSTPLAIEKELQEKVPIPYQQHAHHWLINLGRYTCLARRPRCEQCLVSNYCDDFKKRHANTE